MAEDPPGVHPDRAGSGDAVLTASEAPVVPAPPPIPPAPAPARRFPRPRLLPWLGLLLLVGCLHALLREASPPDGVSPRPDQPAPGGVGPDRRGDAGTRGAAQVVLDAGHGGADTGAVANGLAEKDLTLDLARRVAAALERRGVSSRLTRTDDRYVPLSTRARLANGTPGAIFVSIHLNHASTGASGIETFYSGRKDLLMPLPLPVSVGARVWRWVVWLTGGEAPDPGRGGGPAGNAPAAPVEEGLVLAQRIQTALVANTSAADRGVKERSLYVTRNVRAPAVLVEGGFLSNGAEARRLGDPAYRQRLAESIAGAIVEYLGLPRRRPGPATEGAAVRPPV